MYDILRFMELTLQQLRVMGGQAVKKKYGIGYFKELNKKSQAARKALKAKKTGTVWYIDFYV